MTSGPLSPPHGTGGAGGMAVMAQSGILRGSVPLWDLLRVEATSDSASSLFPLPPASCLRGLLVGCLTQCLCLLAATAHLKSCIACKLQPSAYGP